MKTIKLFGMVLMTVLMSVGFTACSNDDEEEPSMSITELKTNLIGTWEELGYERDGEVYKEEMTLNSDGTFKYWYFHVWSDHKSLEGTWSLKDDKTISLTSDGQTADYYFSYELESYSSDISNIYISPLFRHNLYKQ